MYPVELVSNVRLSSSARADPTEIHSAVDHDYERTGVVTRKQLYFMLLQSPIFSFYSPVLPIACLSFTLFSCSPDCVGKFANGTDCNLTSE